MVIKFFDEVGVTNLLRLDSSDLPHIAYWDDVTNQLKYGKIDALMQIIFLPLLVEK